MTLSRGFALFLTVAAAGTLLNASDPAETGVGRLKAISAHTNGKGAQLVIEANTPLAYVATRPDPLTVVLDFRNVEAGSVANSVTANAKSPIASVSVEGGESLGSPVSRVRIALTQPVAHHIRSERNTVVVEFDKPVSNAPYVMPPVTRHDPAPAQQAIEAPTGDPMSALGLDNATGGPSAAGNAAAANRIASLRALQPQMPMAVR